MYLLGVNWSEVDAAAGHEIVRVAGASPQRDFRPDGEGVGSINAQAHADALMPIRGAEPAEIRRHGAGIGKERDEDLRPDPLAEIDLHECGRAVAEPETFERPERG